MGSLRLDCGVVDSAYFVILVASKAERLAASVTKEHEVRTEVGGGRKAEALTMARPPARLTDARDVDAKELTRIGVRESILREKAKFYLCR